MKVDNQPRKSCHQVLSNMNELGLQKIIPRTLEMSFLTQLRMFYQIFVRSVRTVTNVLTYTMSPQYSTLRIALHPSLKIFVLQ